MGKLIMKLVELFMCLNLQDNLVQIKLQRKLEITLHIKQRSKNA